MIERAEKTDRPISTAKAEPGYGAGAKDIQRGFTDPGEMDTKGRDLEDHKHKMNEPKPRTVTPDPSDWMADWERKSGERKSKGFLHRPTSGGYHSER